MNDNVKIPLSLFNQLFYILENINVRGYDDVFQTEYFDLLGALHKKKDLLELREAYAAIIRAKDEDSRHWARIRYLRRKRLIDGGV